MKASELIELLQAAIAENGDLETFYFDHEMEHDLEIDDVYLDRKYSEADKAHYLATGEIRANTGEKFFLIK